MGCRIRSNGVVDKRGAINLSLPHHPNLVYHLVFPTKPLYSGDLNGIIPNTIACIRGIHSFKGNAEPNGRSLPFATALGLKIKSNLAVQGVEPRR